MDLKSSLKEARDAIKNKDYKSALKLSKSILREDKSNYMGLVFLGISLQEEGPVDQAPKAFNKAIQLNSTNVLAWSGLANYYEKHEVNDELILVYTTLLKLESNEPKLIEVLNKIPTILTNDFKDIVSLINGIYGLTKDEKSSNNVKSVALKEINVILNKCNNVPDELSDIYEESFIFLLNNPDTISTEIYTEYVKLLYKLQKYETLITEAEKMFNYNDNNITSLEWMCKVYGELNIEENELHVTIRETVKKYYEVLLRVQGESCMGLLVKSIFLYNAKNCMEARECLRKVTNLRPGLIHPWVLLTKCNIDLHFYENAVESAYKAEKLLQVKNENILLLSKVSRLLCKCLSKCQDTTFLEAAIKLCLQLLENSSNDEEIFNNLVEAYINAKNYVEANMWLNKLQNKTILKAKLLKSQNKLSQALKVLEEQVIQSSEYWNDIGEMYFRLEIYEKALLPFLNAAKLDQNSYLCFLNLGNFYKKARDFDKARRCYEKCLKINQKCSEAGIELCQIYLKQQKWEENLNLLVNLTSNVITANNKWAHIQLGIHYLEQEDYDNAIKSLRLVIRSDPTNSHCWESLADAYLGRGAYTSSLRSYQKATELDPDSLYPILQMANIKMILGEHADARKEFENVLSMNRTYIPALKGIAETCLYQAKIYYRQQLHGLARDSAQYAMEKITIALKQRGDLSCLWKIAAESSNLVTKLPERFCCLMVAAALAEGSNDEKKIILEQEELFVLASRCYCKAINLTDENILIYHDLACCYFSHAKVIQNGENKKKLLEKAMEVVHHCLANNSAYWQHWNLLGNIAFNKEPKDYALAQHAFITAVTLEANSASAWCNLGILYMYIGEVKLANDAFSQAQRGDPNYVCSWVGQALIAESAGHEDAMDLFRHSTQLDANQQGAIGYAFWVCQTLLDNPPDKHIYSIHNMHAVPVACDALTWYVENNPNDSCAWNMLGLLRERMGLKKSASEAFKKSLIFSNQNVKDYININYGRSLYALGNYKEAVRLYQNVKEATFNSGSGLALALFKDEQYEESYEAYEQALHWLTDEAGYQSDLLVALASMAYLFQGADAAKTLLFQSTQLQSRSSWGLYAILSLGLLHKDSNLADLVMKELATEKDNIDTLPHYGILLSYAYLLQGQNTKAIKELSKLIHRHPNTSSLWLTLAILMLHLRKERSVTNAAAKCAKAAMNLGQSKTDITKVLCVISLASIMSGDYKLSLKAAQNAIHCYPDKAESWSVLIYSLKFNKYPQNDINARIEFVKNNLKCTEMISKWLLTL